MSADRHVAKRALAAYAQLDLQGVPHGSKDELLVLERLVRKAFQYGAETQSRPTKTTRSNTPAHRRTQR